MDILADRLHKWSIEELNLASEGEFNSIPDVENFRAITKGKHNRMLWSYVVNNVRSRTTVDKIKRTLYLKKLRESRDSTVSCEDISLNIVKLQAEISRATEKRSNLIRSLSTVKERVLNLDKEIETTKDDTFKISQKTSLLELVKQQYDDKNRNLKILFSEISLCKKSLAAYQSTKVCDKRVLGLPYDFLYENSSVYDQKNFMVRELLNVICSVVEGNFLENKECDALTENFHNNFHELKKSGVLLTDLVILIKEISYSDLEQFTSQNRQSLSTKNSTLNKNKENSAQVHLTQLKLNSVHNSLRSIKNKKIIEKHLAAKEEILENKIKSVLKTEPNDVNYDVKCTLIEKLAENDALAISNSYLESNLEVISNQTESVWNKIRQQELSGEKLSSEIQTFFKHADFTFLLLYRFPDSVKETLDAVDNLHTFAHTELLELPLPEKESAQELKTILDCDRKLTWEYCDKTNIIQLLFSRPVATHLLSPKIQQSLNFQPHQNISSFLEDWVQFKQKLRMEVVVQSEGFLLNSDICVSELQAKFSKLLDKMKFSIEKALLLVDEGKSCCSTNKSLIQEWWEQNAQYIPHIEYKGKTLKMWLDILSVFCDFESENCD